MIKMKSEKELIRKNLLKVAPQLYEEIE